MEFNAAAQIESQRGSSPSKSKTRRKPANGKCIARTRSLPGKAPQSPKHNKTGIAAAAFIASLAEESARPANRRMDDKGPVQVLRVGSDCSGMGMALDFPTNCCQAARLVHIQNTSLQTLLELRDSKHNLA